MLGLSDLSLIPSQLFDQLSVTRGGSSAALGNGAITGVIDLSDDSSLTDKTLDLDLNLGMGSYGLRQAGIKSVLKHKKWQSSTNLYTAASTNDFSYQLTSGQERQNVHARFNTSAWLQSVSYQIKANQKIKLQSWLQNTEREIPPTTTQNRSEARQEDQIKRFRLSYELNNSKSSLQSQLAYFDENNIYDDPQILIYNDNQFKRLIHKSKYTIVLPHDVIIRSNTEAIYTQGQSESYEDIESLSSYAITGGLKKTWGLQYVDLTMRYERNSLDNEFFSPAIIYNHRLSTELSLQAKVSREYRFPTLNELYWRPGGNTELLSEHGWNQELNLSYNKSKSGLIKLNLYHRLINDWILWSAVDNSFFFAPFNISKVRSYGTELSLYKNIDIGELNLDITAAHNYTVSENLVAITSPKIKQGDQLFYIPLHQISSGIRGTYKKVGFSINGQYNSTTVGTLETLNGYTLINSSLDYTVTIGHKHINLSLVINNITNTNYRIIERRPMMGRNYNLNINYKI